MKSLHLSTLALALLAVLALSAGGAAAARPAAAGGRRAPKPAFAALPLAERLVVVDLASHDELLAEDAAGHLALDSAAALAAGYPASAVDFLAAYYAAHPTPAQLPSGGEARTAGAVSAGTKLAKAIAKAILANKAKIVAKLEGLLGRATVSRYLPLDRLAAILDGLVTVDNTIDGIIGSALRLLVPVWLNPMIPAMVWVIRLLLPL